MNLSQLIKPLLTAKIVGTTNIEINGIEVDSRKVNEGNLFVCLKGYTVDGHLYAEKAVELGAKAILCEKELPVTVTQIIIKDTRQAMAMISDIYYQHPTHRLKVIGVTGTNGKTTTTHLIERILTDKGHIAGLIGTIKMKIGDEVFDVKNTTPDALDLQKSFAKMIEVGSDYAVMEASSHALDMGRVRGIDYHIAVFTNLTQDHLDYHVTMEKYRDTKGLLFSQLGNTYAENKEDNKFAVLNIDDEASHYYSKITAAQVITYGIDQVADVMATNIEISAMGTKFTLNSFNGSIDIDMKMIGKFSVYNALAATTVALIEGISLDDIKASLESVNGVDGRFETVDEQQDFAVIVDYAHTPDSLENVLKTIREFVKGKIYCVFGAGGDRDRIKRPLMGGIAMKYSDIAVITSDNPRTEDPEQIIKDILPGVQQANSHAKYVTITDRKKAIEYAIEHANKNDVILIAGKGHETYQILQDKVIHFDDREIAREAIRRMQS